MKYFLDACIQSVEKAIVRYDAEIIVADNASTDGSKAYFEHKYPDIKFLWFAKNDGFAKGNNLAVQQAKGEYLLILNPDTLVAENIFDELFSFTNDKPDFGIIGGKMIDGTGHFLPESKRGIPSPIVAFSKLTKLHKLLNFKPFNNYYNQSLPKDKAGKTAILTGAFMFLTKETFLSVGGFDEQYFMFGEDIDLSYSILKNGKQNYYLPTAKIIHFKGESTQKDQKYYQRFVDTTFQFQEKHFRTFLPQKFLMQSFFKLWMKMRIKKAKITNTVSNFNKIYFIGNKEDIKNIETNYNNPVTGDLNTVFSEESLIIFDTSAYSFSTIINFMEKNIDKKLYYRFYFPTSRIIIGSDSKEKLGKVIHL